MIAEILSGFVHPATLAYLLLGAAVALDGWLVDREWGRRLDDAFGDAPPPRRRSAPPPDTP